MTLSHLQHNNYPLAKLNEKSPVKTRQPKIIGVDMAKGPDQTVVIPASQVKLPRCICCGALAHEVSHD